MSWEDERKRIWALIIELQRRVKVLEQKDSTAEPEATGNRRGLDVEMG